VLSGALPWQALFLALKYGYTDVAEHLISAGADFNLKDETGFSCAEACNPRVYEAQMQQIRGMGFDVGPSLKALLQCSGDLEKAVDLLMS